MLVSFMEVSKIVAAFDFGGHYALHDQSVFALSAVSWSQTKASVPSKPTVNTLSDSTKSQPQAISAPGRYQIFFSPNVRADTFLVDTSTGRIWRMMRFTATQISGLGFDPNALTSSLVSKGVLPKDAMETTSQVVDWSAKSADTLKAQAQTRDIGTQPTAWVLEDRLDSDDEFTAWATRQQRAAALEKASPAPDH
jgi:hypothetical protein